MHDARSLRLAEGSCRYLAMLHRTERTALSESEKAEIRLTVFNVGQRPRTVTLALGCASIDNVASFITAL
jgi:hypothetical protein